MSSVLLNSLAFPKRVLLTSALAVAWSACGGDDNPNPMNNRPDAGMSEADAGSPDAGPTNTCVTDDDCPVTGDRCITPAGQFCNNNTDCLCATPCDANTDPTGCEAGEGCLWLVDSAIGGACVTDPGGMPQAAACTAAFDENGNFLNNTCALNHICRGANPVQPSGACARLCPAGDDAPCSALGNFTCVAGPGAPLGICLEPEPEFTDIATRCEVNADCQGGVCIGFDGNTAACSADCGGVSQCPTGSLCVSLGSVFGDLCFLDCTETRTSTCASRNPDYTCHEVGSVEEPVGLCFANCNLTQDMCLFAGGQCDPGTGECS